VRDAVRAARAALPAWSGRTAYNRGQILYRMAEVLEARTEELAASVADGRGLSRGDARGEVAAAVDTCVHYAGWTDKLDAVLGSVNPVAQPFFSFSMPEPVGVVAILAPATPDLLGLVTHVAPALAGANVVVAVVSEPHPLASLDLAEVLATSDVPAGVVNLVSGRHEELAPVLAAHADVDCILDAAGDAARTAGLRRAAAANVTRFRAVTLAPADYLGDAARSLEAVERTLETKTTWHPVGA
jgi:acyl-CoA reductase-like NAD-dependent aldehyde dehydrogenase